MASNQHRISMMGWLIMERYSARALKFEAVNFGLEWSGGSSRFLMYVTPSLVVRVRVEGKIIYQTEDVGAGVCIDPACLLLLLLGRQKKGQSHSTVAAKEAIRAHGTG